MFLKVVVINTQRVFHNAFSLGNYTLVHGLKCHLYPDSKLKWHMQPFLQVPDPCLYLPIFHVHFHIKNKPQTQLVHSGLHDLLIHTSPPVISLLMNLLLLMCWKSRCQHAPPNPTHQKWMLILSLKCLLNPSPFFPLSPTIPNPNYISNMICLS